MTESKIKCFIAVAQTGSFVKAAETLFISQPSVSKQVSQLEEELGFLLLDRTHRVIVLTDIGQMYYDFFLETEARLKALAEIAPKTNLSHKGSIRIGYPNNWNQGNFEEPFARFTQQYPNISFTFHPHPSAAIPNILRNAEVDLVICPSYLLHKYGCITKRITNIAAVLLYPNALGFFHPEQLHRHSLFTDVPYGSPQDIIERVCVYFKSSSFKLRQTSDLSAEIMLPENRDEFFLADTWSTNLAGGHHDYHTMDLKLPVVMGCVDNESKDIRNFVMNEFLFHT